MTANKILTLFIIAVVTIELIFSAKLNVPKVLLPYFSNVSTNFTLDITQGCYKWSSSRPEIAAVYVAGGEECAKAAVIVATSRVPSRKTAVITANDPASGETIRCDVIVDVIRGLAIETTTHELYLDDSPEEFVIRASNEDGDVFSSLDGLVFEWNLLPDTESGLNLAPANNILRLQSFSESSYESPAYISALEASGLRGDRVLVRGLRTGSARVTVRPTDPALKLAEEPVVRIIVMANIQLSPGVYYLLPHTSATYTVLLYKQNQALVVNIPSDQYYLEVTNTTVGRMIEKSSTAHALALGETEVVLKDRNIGVGGLFREPCAGLVVVLPGYLEFSVMPGRSWVLQTDTVYDITIDVYDKESHRIHPADNIRIEAEFPKEFFDVQYSSPNGSYHVVKTLKKGFTQIDALFQVILLEDGSEQRLTPGVQNAQEVEIYDPVLVTPLRLVLPWLPLSTRIHNSVQVQAEGGSGNYTWSSSKQEVATVTTQGRVVVATKTGQTVVKAADAKNPAHFDTMRTLVLPPGKMGFARSPLEAELGSTLTLPLVVYAQHESKWLEFAECHLMPLSVTIDKPALFKYVQAVAPTVEGSCAGLEFIAGSQGSTKVTVTYSHLNVTIKAVALIAAYQPLKAVDEVTLVTLAASRELLWTGGPQPWELDGSKYFVRPEPQHTAAVAVLHKSSATHKSRHSVRVLCTAYGEQTITLYVGNDKTKTNEFPAVASATVRFICAEPRDMHLVPLVSQPTDLPMPCPVNALNDNPVPVHNYESLNLQLVLQDAEGRRFDNFSSLAVDWAVSEPQLARLRTALACVDTELVPAGGEAQRIVSYRTLEMSGKSGHTDVTVSASAYNPVYLRHAALSQQKLTESLSTLRCLQLVDDAQLNPAAVALYNHDTHQAVIDILEGSGHFHVTTIHSSLDAITAAASPGAGREVRVSARREGEFTVTAHDLCLVPRKPATATVTVSDVHRITLTVIDKVQIEHDIEAVVQVLDKRGQPIPAKYFRQMGLKAQHGHLISAVLTSKEDSETTATYRVKGVSLGRTQLQFVAAQQQGGAVIRSNVQEIQVFPPLRLEPRNFTVVIGASFQVAAHGGPQPQASIEFEMEDGSVGSVTNGGLLHALALGSTRVRGRAVGISQADNARVVYSQDEVWLHVVSLAGIRIFSPLQRLQTHTKMPLYAVGLGENETPFTLGTASPPLRFHWTISNSDVATLKPLFYKSGIIPGAENNFAVRLRSEEPGHVTVSVRVTAADGSRLQLQPGASLTDSVQIEVFEALRVTSPAVCDGKLLLTPDTRTQIRTNRDGTSARLVYCVVSADSGAPGGSSSQGVVSVDEYGQATAGSRPGTAAIVITAHEPNGLNQTTLVAVQVGRVSYLMVNSASRVWAGAAMSHVPLGASLTLDVSFHDASGQRFDATDAKIGFRPHRFDLLQLVQGSDNDTLLARATNVGHTAIKVWDRERPWLVDYVGIDVAEVITPTNSDVTLGDVVCFSSPLVTQRGGSGVWQAEGDIVTLDPATGVAVTTSVGKVLVTQNVSAALATHTQLRVGGVSGVTLSAGTVEYVGNARAASHPELFLPLRIKNAQGTAIHSHIHGENCSGVLAQLPGERQKRSAAVRCEVALSGGAQHAGVHVSQLVTVASKLDLASGRYSCVLSPVEVPFDLVANLDTELVVRAHVGGHEDTLQVPYVPRVHVLTPELHLSNQRPAVKLRLTASPRVQKALQVTSEDSSLAYVSSSSEREPDSSGGTVHTYSVQLALSASLWERGAPLSTQLHVRCGLTGHVLTVPVSVQLFGDRSSQQQLTLTWQEWMAQLWQKDLYQLLALICAIVLSLSCFLIAYMMLLGGKQSAQPTPQQAAAFAATPSTPQQQQLNTSGLMFNQTMLSPAGSPPRLWSVDYGPYELYKRSPASPPRS